MAKCKGRSTGSVSEWDHGTEHIFAVIIVGDALRVDGHVQIESRLDCGSGTIVRVEDGDGWFDCTTDALVITCGEDLYPIICTGDWVHGHPDTNVQVFRVHQVRELSGIGVELSHGQVG